MDAVARYIDSARENALVYRVGYRPFGHYFRVNSDSDPICVSTLHLKEFVNGAGDLLRESFSSLYPSSDPSVPARIVWSKCKGSGSALSLTNFVDTLS